MIRVKSWAVIMVLVWQFNMEKIFWRAVRTVILYMVPEKGL
jgi:hypothetical protein